MKEIWKDIEGYEGLYQVSNIGRVRSLDRCVERNGGISFIKGRILKPARCGRQCNYWFVGLSKNGKVKQHYIHRLVAQAFIPNPENLPEVNHKDERPENNCVDNLEWCTALYNLTYNDRHIKAGKKERGKKSLYRKKVKLLKNGEWFMTFLTPKDAGDFIGVTDSTVRQNIYGKTNLIKDIYSFQYLDGSGKLSDEELKRRSDRANYLRRERYARIKI